MGGYRLRVLLRTESRFQQTGFASPTSTAPSLDTSSDSSLPPFPARYSRRLSQLCSIWSHSHSSRSLGLDEGRPPVDVVRPLCACAPCQVPGHLSQVPGHL